MRNRIIILNGPSSSGKSTLARVLQDLILEKLGDLYEIVSIDDYLKMSAHEAIYEDDVFEISPALSEAASRALRNGRGVIVDHVITSVRVFDRLTAAFSGRRPMLVRVTCPREVLLARESARGDRCPGSAEASDAYLFPRDGYELTVDTHSMSAAECADRIFRYVFPEAPESHMSGSAAPENRYWLPKAGFRGYRDEDYDAVCAFLIALNQTDRTHINWNWARFEWMMEHPEFDKSAESTIGLWWSGGKVVGAAIYDMYFGEAFCGVLPGFETLYPEILDYAYRELKDDSGLAVAIHQENEAEIKAALQAGFAPTDQKETVMELSLDRNFTSVLPGGLRLREMDQIADRDALEWLFWQGFDHGDDRDAFERSRDRAAHVRKHFNRTLSLSAADPSGEPVSHCSLWFHPDTDYAYVEPVCTIPGLRGRGIASALLSEAFSRAKALGAKKAYVISDLPFYEKLGFEKTRRCVFYRKK